MEYNSQIKLIAIILTGHLHHHSFDFLLSVKAGGFHVNHILVCQTKIHMATV